MLAFYYWNPSKTAFSIPYFDHPIAWYGIFFVLGFVTGYLVIRPLLGRFLMKSENLSLEEAVRSSKELTDSLCWYAVIGTIVGARIGHVLFYDLHYYFTHPLEIFKTWEGGLASHGGVIGVMLAIYFFYKKNKDKHPSLSYLRILDFVSVPSALVAVFIRLGNFVNQEIIGTPTSLPWGVIFGNPEGPFMLIPRHPVQLYEAICYLISFFILYFAARYEKPQKPAGKIIGLLFVLIFGSRFFLEFLKNEQASFLNFSILQAGQWLSIPFILLGFFLIWRREKSK